MANCALSGEEVSAVDLFAATAVGGLSGLVGGRGANGAKLRGVVKHSKNVLKTAVSPKKIVQYTTKMVKCYKNAAVSIGRTVWAGVTSNYLNGKRKQVTQSSV